MNVGVYAKAKAKEVTDEQKLAVLIRVLNL